MGFLMNHCLYCRTGLGTEPEHLRKVYCKREREREQTVLLASGAGYSDARALVCVFLLTASIIMETECGWVICLGH